MKNTNYKLRTWAIIFDTTVFLAPTDLIDEDTPDVTKFVTLAKVRKTNKDEFTYSVFGNSDYMPEFNEGKVLTGTSPTRHDAMIAVEDALEQVYPVNEELEPEPEPEPDSEPEPELEL